MERRKRGKVTVSLEKKGSIIVIKEVPAQVCSNCGHYYLSETITKQVLKKGTEAIKKRAELEAVKLKVA